MAETEFFATPVELRRLVQAIEQTVPVRYVRCLASGRLERPEFDVYESLLDMPDLGLVTTEDGYHQIDYIVIEPNGLDRLRIEPDKTAHSRGGYLILRDENDDPRLLWLTPGGQYLDRYLRVGTISTGHGSAQSVACYLQIIRWLERNFERIGSRYYGKEALALGQQGMGYAYELDPYLKTVGIWGYEASVEARLEDARLAAIPRTTRLSLEDSWEWLRIAGYDPPFTADGKPFILSRPPALDEEEEDEENEDESDPQAGFAFYHAEVDHGDLHHLTLPRTEFCECEVCLFSFHDSDLHEAYIYENDWFDCDFSAADLSASRIGAVFVRCNFTQTIFTGANLRDSSFVDCDFTGAIMADTDLRGALFRNCNFSGTVMDHARMTHAQELELEFNRSGTTLSPSQRRIIDWEDEDR